MVSCKNYYIQQAHDLITEAIKNGEIEKLGLELTIKRARAAITCIGLPLELADKIIEERLGNGR